MERKAKLMGRGTAIIEMLEDTRITISPRENHICTWFTKNPRLCLQKNDSQFYLHPQKTGVNKICLRKTF